MVKIDNLNNPTETNQTNPNQNQSPTQKSGLITLLGQLLPLAPFAFEQMTGQKVPALTGTMAEVQTALFQIQTNLQTIANNQQSLNQRLVQLETNATNQFNNLTHQFKNWRLTHTKEQKQIEYGNSSNTQLEDPDPDY